MAETTSGFHTAFEALTKLQEVQFSALRADVAEVKADVKRVDTRIDGLETRQDQTDELLDGMKAVVDLLSKLADKKNLAVAGGAFSIVTFLAQLVARLF
jgi:hypothetical protein